MGMDEAVVFVDAVHHTHQVHAAGCWAPKGTLVALIWGKLMMEKHYHGAALASLLGVFVSRNKDDKEFESGSFQLLFKAVDELRNENQKNVPLTTAPACSFCGRSEPDVRLAGGAHGFICDACVNTLSDVFTTTKPKS
jgi:hypothetical protein